ncbi:hypothetical protein NDU88_010905 [Pleurodeles waltl]|uniref:Uncharacterized protein n=1 Tax=Pleurodeles waltl TaxID=8319 RepID=A0AAV7Q3A5_PLEWA|nr:hypothetical protein NDU88_010905 [Pleurodeles waltl]
MGVAARLRPLYASAILLPQCTMDERIVAVEEDVDTLKHQNAMQESQMTDILDTDAHEPEEAVTPGTLRRLLRTLTAPAYHLMRERYLEGRSTVKDH